jgi:hypothetical protein
MKMIILILAMAFLFPVISFAQDAREITNKAIEITRIDAMEMASTLKIFDAKGNERTRQTVTASKKFGNTTKVITRFISPADVKGTAILLYDHEDKDDDMWIYMPALRKTRRIVSSEKGKSYMGSEFSNADMSVPNLDDFTYRMLGSEQCNGVDCWKIEAVPLDEDIADNNGYSKRISWVDKSSYFTYKNTFFDFDDLLFKEITMDQYEEVDEGKFIMCKMEAKNLENGRRSVMTIDQIQKGSTLTENSFAPSALEK